MIYTLGKRVTLHKDDVPGRTLKAKKKIVRVEFVKRGLIKTKDHVIEGYDRSRQRFFCCPVTGVVK